MHESKRIDNIQLSHFLPLGSAVELRLHFGLGHWPNLWQPLQIPLWLWLRVRCPKCFRSTFDTRKSAIICFVFS